MSFDFKLGMIYYGLALMILLVIGCAAMIRFIINHAFAASGHDFYVLATEKQPKCATCPFSARCPYSNGVTCHFAIKKGGL